MIRFLQTSNAFRRVGLVLIIGVVIVSMVMFLGSYFTGDRGVNNAGVYAVVGDQQVTTQEVRYAAQSIAQQQMQGRAVPEQFMSYFEKQAADRLVLTKALEEEARRIGLKASEQEVVEVLHRGELGQALFPNGQFVGEDKYKEIVAGYTRGQMSVDKFEEQLRADILRQKLFTVLFNNVTVPESDVREAFNKQNVKVKFDYAVLKTEDLMKQVSATDAELQAWFDAHKGNFENSIPEQRKARYVVIDPAKVNVPITDEELQAAYNQRKESYKTPEKIDVRHILISATTPEDLAKTKAKAEDIKKQLDKGANFAELAKKYSEDPGSKDNGGLYDGVLRGQFVPEFEKVAFSQPVGKVSDLVQSKFGWHIIKTEKHYPETVKPLSEVRGELETAIKAEKGANQVSQLASAVETEARTQGLDKAAAKNGLTVVNTDFFNQAASLPGIGPNASEFMQQVFSLKKQDPPQRVALADGFAVVQVTDSKPSATPSFEQARAQVEQQYKNERATKMLADKTKELADRARALNDLKKAAKELGATVKTSQLVAPTATVEDVGAMSGPGEVVFDLQPNQISAPVMSGRNGIVMKLLEKQQPTDEEYKQKEAQIRDGLVQRKRDEALQLFLATLRDRMEKDGTIKINAAERQRLLGRSAGV